MLENEKREMVSCNPNNYINLPNFSGTGGGFLV